MADDEEPELITVAEAARVLGFSIKTLARWVDEGRLGSVVIDGERRVARGEVLTLFLRRLTDTD